MTQQSITGSTPRPFILAGLHQAIADTEDMFTRLDFTLAQVRGALAANHCRTCGSDGSPCVDCNPLWLAVVDDAPVIEDATDEDYVEGDTHGCPGERFHSHVEAAGAAFAMEETHPGLIADYCPRCDGFHLVLERTPAGRFLVD